MTFGTHRNYRCHSFAAKQSIEGLVTTRNRSVLPGSSSTHSLNRLNAAIRAAFVLTLGVPDIPGAAVTELEHLTGRWPVLLGISNRTLHRMVQYGSAPAAAAETLIERLRERGPTALDVANPQARQDAVAATVDAGAEICSRRALESAISSWPYSPKTARSPLTS